MFEYHAACGEMCGLDNSNYLPLIGLKIRAFTFERSVATQRGKITYIILSSGFGSQASWSPFVHLNKDCHWIKQFSCRLFEDSISIAYGPYGRVGTCITNPYNTDRQLVTIILPMSKICNVCICRITNVNICWHGKRMERKQSLSS